MKLNANEPPTEIDNECAVDSTHTITTFVYNGKELRMLQREYGEDDGESWTGYIF